MKIIVSIICVTAFFASVDCFLGKYCDPMLAMKIVRCALDGYPAICEGRKFHVETALIEKIVQTSAGKFINEDLAGNVEKATGACKENAPGVFKKIHAAVGKCLKNLKQGEGMCNGGGETMKTFGKCIETELKDEIKKLKPCCEVAEMEKVRETGACMLQSLYNQVKAKGYLKKDVVSCKNLGSMCKSPTKEAVEKLPLIGDILNYVDKAGDP